MSRAGPAFGQMYMSGRSITDREIMKKPGKTKGRKAAAEQGKKQTIRYAVVAVSVVIVLSIIGLILFYPIAAKAGDTVSVYYTGMLDDGTVFDSNVNGTPLEFTLGAGQMIPGFDKAVTGMAVGEEKTVTLAPDEAYGPYYPDFVVTVNRSANFSIENPVVGQHLIVTVPSTGTTTRVKILNVTPSTVTIDANADLAGQNLTFRIKLASITQA